MMAVKRWFGSLPIRGKLMLLATFASGIALVLAGIVLALADYHSGRGALIRRLQTQAQITAKNSSAALAFEDAKVAGTTLEALGADHAIVAAEILRVDGTPLARYGNVGSVRARKLPQDGSADGLIHVSAPVALDETIGTVNLWATDAEVRAELLQHAAILTGVIFGALLLALLAVARLQRIVSEPLVKLAKATATVSRTRDYSLRVESRNSDEIGQLMGSFNDMLGQIQERDRELQRAHDDLEIRVRERTRELATATERANEMASVAQAANQAKSRVPRQHEPRNPHADERRDRHDRSCCSTRRSTATQRDYAETHPRQRHALLTVINDILDFSKIEAGKLELEALDVDLRDAVEEVARLHAVQRRGEEARTDGAGRSQPSRARAAAIAGRIRQVLLNLGGNAIKFTAEGEVS